MRGQAPGEDQRSKQTSGSSADCNRPNGEIVVTIATYNALAMKAEAEAEVHEGMVSLRRRLVRLQALQRKVRVMGVQETRQPAGVPRGDGFVLFAAGADAGHRMRRPTKLGRSGWEEPRRICICQSIACTPTT
eukprot:566479-Pyramimonas_sp.AAC.1